MENGWQITQSWKLSASEVKKLERKLKVSPDDLYSRLLLVGYYGQHVYVSKKARKQHQKQFLWILKYAPASAASDTHLQTIFPSEPAYQQAKKLWGEHLRREPTNLRILENAAIFFLINESPRASRLFKRAHALDPTNPHWSERLAQVFSFGCKGLDEKVHRAAGKRWLDQMELALALTKDKQDQFGLLDDLARAAFAAGDFEKARRYARRLLRQAARLKEGADRSDAIHRGNIVLGKMALIKGNVSEANRRLLMSGQVSGSPVLGSFGPNLRLAKQLLERGERGVVVKYFRLCINFWKSGREDVERWIGVVQSGGIPDLGIHLDH